MKVTTLNQFENGIERVVDKMTQYATKASLANKLDSTGKAETAGTADNAIRDGEGNVISSTYLKKSDNVTVDLSDYQTAAQADAKYLGKNDTATNSEKATKDGQDRNIADTYITKAEASSTYLAKTALNVISTVPSQSGSVTYDGTAKTPTWLNYDPLKLQISGDYQNKTNAGTYQTGFKPISPYTWTNGSQTVQNANWTIGKAAGKLSLSAESGSVNIDATSTFTVDRAGDGAITVTSSNANTASVSVSGNTVTVTGKAAGSATITVKVAEGSNHFAPADKTYAVTVTKIPLNLSASISDAVTYNTTGTINLNGNSGGGAVTATSDNSSCVTVSSTTANTVTVKCANYNAATTQISINVAETTKYTSGTTTCNVTTAKAAGSVTLSATSGTATYGTPITFTVWSNLSGGVLSVTSADIGCVTATINDSTITVTPINCSIANHIITVKSAETDNYNEAIATYNITLNKAAGTLNLSETSIVFNASAEKSVTAVTNSTGNLTQIPTHLTASDPHDCSIIIKDRIIYFTALSTRPYGNAYFKVYGDDNHTDSPTVEVSLYSNSTFPAKIADISNSTNVVRLSEIFRAKKFKVGDYMDITLADDVSATLPDTGEVYIVPANTILRAVCIGINHNTDVENSSNKAHFAILKNANNINIGRFANAYHATNEQCSWEDSELRNWLNTDFYNALPSPLKNAISPITKYTAAKDYSKTPYIWSLTTVTEDKIWTMSEAEIYGHSFDNDYEIINQQQYEYYQNGNSVAIVGYPRPGLNEQASATYWTRTPGITVNEDSTFYGWGDLNDTVNYIIPCFAV